MRRSENASTRKGYHPEVTRSSGIVRIYNSHEPSVTIVCTLRDPHIRRETGRDFAQARSCSAIINTRTPAAMNAIRAERGPCRRQAATATTIDGTMLSAPRTRPVRPPPPANKPGTMSKAAIKPAHVLSGPRSSECLLALHHGVGCLGVDPTTDTFGLLISRVNICWVFEMNVVWTQRQCGVHPTKKARVVGTGRRTRYRRRCCQPRTG